MYDGEKLIKVVKTLWKKWWAWTIALVSALIIWMLENGRIPSGIQPIKDALSNACDATTTFLSTNLSIPRWWYWILFLAFMGMAFYVLYHLVWLRLFSSYRTYTEDAFETIFWRWKWSKRGWMAEGEPYRIRPYCPNCDIELSIKRGVRSLREMANGGSPPKRYVCGGCKTEFPYVHHDDVKYEIMRIKRGWHR